MNRHDQYMKIADECPEFDPLVCAQGYGISFLNEATIVSCQECTNWDDGHCGLYIEASQAYSRFHEED